MNGRPLTLALGDTIATVSPQAGGALSAATIAGVGLFAPLRTVAVGLPEALAQACFPMVPYANRIGFGRFSVGRRLVLIPPNMGDHPHPLHGEGWRRPWLVETAGSSSATLVLDAASCAHWPWKWRARQEWTVFEDGAGCALSVTNTDDEPMPATLGLHPYFAGQTRVRLRANLSGMWRTEQDLPVALYPPPDEFASPEGGAISGLGLDHCFSGWDGVCDLLYAEGGRLRIEAKGCSFLQVYAPAGQDYFCVEPQTAMPDALNRQSEDSGFRLLRPGESLQMSMRIRTIQAPRRS